MDNHLLAVLTNPVEGQEDTFNQWYNDVHLKDVLAILALSRASVFN